MSEYVVYLPHHYQANDFKLTVDLFTYESQYVLNEQDVNMWPMAMADPVLVHANSIKIKQKNHSLIHPYLDFQKKENQDDEIMETTTTTTTAATAAAASTTSATFTTSTTTLCNFNTISKMEPVMFSIWLDVMVRTPSTILWLLQPKGTMGNIVVENLKKEAASQGISPLRIVMAKRVPKFQHLNRLKFCDLFLDTFIYTAHSTASDVLWAGVPILTIKGKTFASRVCSTLLENAGK